MRCSVASVTTSSNELDVPGSMSIIAQVGWWGWSAVDVHGCSSMAPKLAAHASAAALSSTE